jgi:general secretion pathway protein G
MRNRSRKAFTLVEILIVVVILGILAAIVVPQFTNATQDAQAGNLKAQIKSLQNQIELFNARNNGTYPDFATDGWTTMISGNYIKAAPQNPACSDADKTTISAGATGTGSATTAWFWNSGDNSLYASNFNETLGEVSAVRTD